MASSATPGLGRRGQLAVLAFVGALGAVGAVVRITGGAVTPTTPSQCQAALAAAAHLTPLAKGEVALFRPVRVSQDLSDLAFYNQAGHVVALSSFAPKTVLVNFWATWCVPCREEMPALDRLQVKRVDSGLADLEVVAVSLDTGASATVEREQAFLNEVGATHLTLYADHKLSLTRELKRRGVVFGLPTTILVDQHGCEIGSAEGGVAWDSADAVALISAAAKQG